MELKLFERYYINFDDEKTLPFFQGWYLIWLVTKHFQFKWFTEFGEWFLYIHLGRRWWRFSSAGYMKG